MKLRIRPLVATRRQTNTSGLLSSLSSGAGGLVPVSEHLPQGSSPLCDTDLHQSGPGLWRRRPPAPCRRLRGQGPRMLRKELPAGLLVMTQRQWERCSDNSLFVNLLQHQPAVVPAPNAVRVSDNHRLGLIKSLGAEGVLLGEASKFIE
jgi:hypothetical protein